MFAVFLLYRGKGLRTVTIRVYTVDLATIGRTLTLSSLYSSSLTTLLGSRRGTVTQWVFLVRTSDDGNLKNNTHSVNYIRKEH